MFVPFTLKAEAELFVQGPRPESSHLFWSVFSVVLRARLEAQFSQVIGLNYRCEKRVALIISIVFNKIFKAGPKFRIRIILLSEEVPTIFDIPQKEFILTHLFHCSWQSFETNEIFLLPVYFKEFGEIVDGLVAHSNFLFTHDSVEVFLIDAQLFE